MGRIVRSLAKLAPRPLRGAVVRLADFYRSQEPFGIQPFPSHEAALRTLQSLGWNPRLCIDVGAYHGTWAEMFRSFFPDCRVLMIEAQEAKRERLQDAARRLGPGVTAELALLGARDGLEVDFAEMETGSSVFHESSFVDRHVVRRKLITLHTLLDRHRDFHDAQFLKLDTQGYELEVLRGAGDMVKKLDALLLEVPVIPINAGCPTFHDVVAFVSGLGFVLFDFCSQIRRRDGVLWATDLLFIRKDGPIQVSAELTRENWHMPEHMPLAP